MEKKFLNIYWLNSHIKRGALFESPDWKMQIKMNDRITGAVVVVNKTCYIVN